MDWLHIGIHQPHLAVRTLLIYMPNTDLGYVLVSTSVRTSDAKFKPLAGDRVLRQQRKPYNHQIEFYDKHKLNSSAPDYRSFNVFCKVRYGLHWAHAP